MTDGSGTRTLFGETFLNGDVIQVNLATMDAQIVFSESVFSQNENVNAVGMSLDGNLLLSTATTATIVGTNFTTTFRRGDLVEWDGDDATIVLVGADVFDDGAEANENIVAAEQLLDGYAISTAGNAFIDGNLYRDGDVFALNGGVATLLFSEDTFTSLNGGVDAFSVYNAAIPEPSSALLAAVGALVIRRSVRRRRPTTPAVRAASPRART